MPDGGCVTERWINLLGDGVPLDDAAAADALYVQAA
jgi:hypothetical protein